MVWWMGTALQDVAEMYLMLSGGKLTLFQKMETCIFGPVQTSGREECKWLDGSGIFGDVCREKRDKVMELRNADLLGR